ncbi:DUF2378 family protein [Hyalangium rubrum]|uniref:DUF2378 family protein n=1 Tax=Hyalangium rubrum TaxID=3103134 RepID=A0ABU5GXF6_9BACT|nr:DUF2378 family protein [Hyalangium sp. s54d21]MDY7225874.1 DUF2378 family protein [Hyalangium sp. s54d21]
MQEKLVFDQTLEGLFVRGLAGRVTPTLKGHLREAGVDLDRKLLPAYPFATWCWCVRLAARELYASQPEEHAYRHLGERMVDGYRVTMLGRALFSVLQMLGPRRVVGRAQQSFRSGNNYTEVRIQDLAPAHLELWVNEAGPTRYLVQGAMMAGLRGCGVKEVQVEVHAFSADDVTFHVKWRDEKG